VLVTRQDFPANDLRQFIAYARAHPGELKYGSAGVGSAIHIGCVLFNAAARIDATHIPYRGGGPAMQDLVAGRIDYNCQIITSASPQVRDKQVKAPALLGATRAPLLPDLATAQEQGMAGFDAGSWNAIFLPKGTPEPIIRKLNAAMSEAMDSPETEKRLLAIGIDIPAKVSRTPAYAAYFVQHEIRKYEGPIKASRIVIE
jgi:tripartite-type tricarboxylate transporter receptor subunit TctC